MIRYWYMLLADMLLTALGIIIGLMLRLEVFYIGQPLFGYFLRIIWPYILITALIHPMVFYFTGIYSLMWRYATTNDFLRLSFSILLGTLIMVPITLLVLFPRYMITFPRSLLILEGVFSLLFLGGLRVLLMLTERYSGDINWRAVNLPSPRRALIVGAGEAGAQMIRELTQNPQLGLKPVAALDDDFHKIGRRIRGLPIYGPIAKLIEVVKINNIDEVVIAMPSAPDQTLQAIRTACQSSRIPYSAMPSISSFILDSSTIQFDDEKPGKNLRIPMAMPDITGKEIQAVVRVLQSRNLSIGSQIVEFEKLAAAEAQARFAVAVINGTSALHLCVVAAGISEGDEVITTPYSFISSANCILYERAKPVFVDIDPITLNIDPNRIEAAITPRTKAILPVHLFGQPADMDPILEIAERHGLLVLEDACEALGAEYKGKKVGALGKAGAFAFYPNKQITTGEGAVLVTNDEEWYYLFRSLRNQGRDRFDEWLNHSRLGYNYRMTEMNAAVGVVQMGRLNELLTKRQAVADMYNHALQNIDGIKPLTIVPDTTRMSWFIYIVRFDPGINRDRVLSLLSEHGIPTRPYFTPIHLQPFYQQRFGYKKGDFPISENAGQSSLALPFFTGMKQEEVNTVCELLAETIHKVKTMG